MTRARSRLPVARRRDEPENQNAVCPFHHLRCIHDGYLRVFGRAPDGLTWFLGGLLWRGPGMA